VILPGPRNSLADIAGLQVGNAHDIAAWSGVTVVLPERPVLAAVDVRGGSPFTVNTATLDPSSIVKALHGLVLSGGSAFGLEAAAGLTSWLAVRGRGASIAGASIPTVAGAIIYDLANGGDKAWGEMPPYRELARSAAEQAGPDFALGNAGAGYGAIAGRIKGGLGTASAVDPTTGATVAALVVVNPVGSVTMPGGTVMWAWHLEQAGELGGQIPPTIATGHQLETKDGIADNTTIGVIATDAALDQGQLRRLAVMAQDGYAYAIRPIHTHLDGDVVFALTTAEAPLPQTAETLVRLGAIAADVMARAVCRGVYLADDLGNYRSYRSLLAPPDPAPAMVG
jgi:L-aminopeptidase/D-esterase-like protein